MTIQDCYAKLSSDYNEVLERLNKPERVEKFFLRFLDDTSYSELVAAVEKTDWPAAFRAAHTLKGTSGTLGISILATPASELTEMLRNGAPTVSIDDVYARVKEAYATVSSVIGEYKASH